MYTKMHLLEPFGSVTDGNKPKPMYQTLKELEIETISEPSIEA